MIYLFDTNTISDLMDEHPRLAARAGSIGSFDRAVTSPIVVGEILYGIERLTPGKKRTDLDRIASELFASMRAEPITTAVAEHYAKIKCERAKVGRTLHDNDLWIAATAKALGAVLVTRDSDFQGIDGLAIENWTA